MLVIHKRKQVRLGGLTIPLSNSIALLLVGIIGNTCVYYDAYATNGNIDDSIKNSTSIEHEEENSTNTVTIDNSNSNDDIGGERGEGGVDSASYTVSRTISPSASLTINSGSNVNNSTITTAGDVAYISNDIRIQASDIESYTLQISYASGSSSLSLADGSVVLSGANNTTPTNMSPNTWGYSWSSTNTNPESTTYQTLSTTNTTLSGDSVSNNSIDFTRRLTFAAKFGEGVKAGHYQTSVLLSLSATPKQVITLSKIANMQDMTTDICAESSIGETTTLKGIRDNNTYTIRKHEDGNCWMTQNLRLTTQSLAAAGHSNTLTSVDTDVDSFTMPTNLVGSGSSVVGWTNSAIKPYSATFNNTTNGTYYNWSVAVAEADTSSLKNNVDAPWSVCPKGWKLPPSTGDGSYSQFMSAAGIGTDKTGVTKIQSTPYNFPMAGHVYAGRLNNNGAWGVYWTRTADSTVTEWAGYLYFTSSKIGRVASETDYWRRSNGYPIRCVAIGS